MIFYGKYTFKSTNPSGQKKFLTSSRGHGRVYPTVSADVVTELQKWIIYQDENNDLLIQMGDLQYLKGIESVGWIVGTTSQQEAYPMRIVDKGNGEVAFKIYVETVTLWMPVRYGLGELQSGYLIFPIPNKDLITDKTETFYNFSKTTITPGLANIQKSNNGKGFDFTNVNFSGAHLCGIDFTGANFNNAILDGTCFKGANLSKAYFLNASMDKTDFSGATLDNAFFTGTTVSNIIWGEAISARGTHFDGCTGIGCQIGGSDMNKHADFTKANFEGATFSQSNFSYAIMKGAKLLRSVFIGAIFQQTDFTGAHLGGQEKSAAAVLAYSFMYNVNFTKTNLFGVSFAFSTLYGALTNMSNTATMEQADFSNAYLEAIVMKGAYLQGAKFNNACLIHVDFTKANLTPTLAGSITSSLANSCLQGAIFTQAKLTNANLTNATVSFDNGTINVRFCDPILGGPSPPPPSFESMNYPATQSLDLTTMTPQTICPNGLTVSANKAQGNTLKQMLTIKHPATEWIPVKCYSPEAELAFFKDRELADSSIKIETRQTVLKRFSLRNFRDLQHLTLDPAAKRFLFWNQDFDEKKLKRLIHYYQVHDQRTGISMWPVYRKVDNAFIGICGLAQNKVAKGVEINVAVMPEFKGNPLVKEMYRAVLDYGFARLNLEYIYGMVDAKNLAALKFVDKIGFTFVKEIILEKDGTSNLYRIEPQALYG